MRNIFRFQLVIIVVVVLLAACTSKQEQQYISAISKFRFDRNQSFLDTSQSPLSDAQIKQYQMLRFFEVKPEWQKVAKLEILRNPQKVELPLSKNNSTTMLKWGKASFTHKGDELSLVVFRELKDDLDTSKKMELFIPFFDETNGQETYVNGRYLHPVFNDETQLILDFNKATNPYCAYNDGWNCTMPPPENALPIPVEAGEKTYHSGQDQH